MDRQADGDGVIHTVVDEITRQTQNLNLDSTVNARAVRPPPGFGVLSSDEVTEPADELPENEVASTPPRIQKEDFPTLSDAMRVTTNNNSTTARNYSERVKQKAKPVDKPKPTDKPKPVDKPKPTRSVISNRSEPPPDPPQHESTDKRRAPDFPPLPSANQSTSASSNGSTSTLNYREKALSNTVDSEFPRYFVFPFYHN